ncbi:NAD(P)H dehydrogenase (quinone) [Kordia sp. SMS9]|uniref:flavodoxin family protein n=1 Tax=Kordia sp. SMS9 TaxID=2282170 RepID=UPI000E0D7903|nr:flavodoxin family protein [Kordia sp. SMS9]AXG70224.1 NAD(P)H dehydrogenase (quinone) [Kordia sp. SMS9]
MIVVVYHSKTGSNKEIAETIYSFIQKKGVEVHIISVEEVENNWKLISDAKGLILGCPTYFGGISSDFKKFMEKSSVFFPSQRWKDKYVTAFTCSGAPSGDKLGTLLQLFLYACQQGMIWVGLGTGYTNSKSEINRLGSWVGLMAQTTDDGKSKVYASDLKTAELLAERMINIIEKK